MASGVSAGLALSRTERLFAQGGGRLDCLDPDGFKYEIKSRETASTNG
jgi:hypothetical protein